MRRKPLYKIFGFFIAVIMLITSGMNATVNAAATDNAVTFQNGLIVLTPEGVNGANPDFFKNYTTNLIPGDEINLAIKLSNASSERIRFFFWASDTDFGDNEEAKALSDDLLSLIYLRIELPNSDDPIYEGPANGKGYGTVGSSKITGTGVSDAISLGWLDAGDLSYLQVTISVPTTLGNEYQSILAAVDWTFLCEIYEVPITEPPITEPPITQPPTIDPPITEPPTIEPPITQPPTIDPPTINPPVTPTPTIPEEELEDISIDDNEIPLGTQEIDIEENGIPLGNIVVDDSTLGKLPQTGTLASVVGNSGVVGSVMFIILMASSILVFIKSRMQKI